MSRRILALALAVLMIASVLVAFAPATHPTGSASPVSTAQSSLARPAVGSIYVAAVDGYGYYDNQFSTGSSPAALLYFEVYDPGGDLFANVSLVDYNASRDGLSSPAFHVEVPINNITGWYYSWNTGVHFAFPPVTYGGWWNLSASAPVGGMYNESVFLSTFSPQIAVTPSSGSTVLPGETVTIYYAVTYNVNGAPYSAATNLSIYGQYYGNGTLRAPLFATYWDNLSASAIGEATFIVPGNATPDTSLNFTFWASAWSHGELAESQVAYGYLLVGVPAVDYVDLSPDANTCQGYSQYDFTTGVSVFACAEVGASRIGGGDFSPVAGLPVDIRYWNGTAFVTPSGGSPTVLTTNSTGYVAWTFTPTIPPFSANLFGGSYGDLVNLTVTDSAATNLTTAPWNWTTGYNQTMYLTSAEAVTGDINVVLGQAVYQPGQTASATWTVGGSNPSVLGAVTVQAWELVSAQSDSILARGTIASTASTGTLSVPLPAGWVGEFYLYVYATNSTTQFSGYATAYVTTPAIVLNINPGVYQPGQTITAAVSASPMPVGGTLEYQVWAYFTSNNGDDQNDGLVTSGTVANASSFTWVAPGTDTPSYYEVTVWLESGTTGLLATTSYEIDEDSGYGLLLGIQTQSKYTDGSYQPGETVTFSYSITSNGAAALPAVFQYYVYVYDTSIELSLQGASSSGTFQVTLPSNTPAGSLEVDMEVYGHGLNGPNCGNDYCYAYTLLAVNPNPSALNMYVGGASTGVTVGWLILLVIIIVVALVLGLLMLRRRRSPPASTGSSTTTPMSPPAPAPNSPAPPEWKEPTADTEPPMPTPPPGAQ